MAKIQFEPPKGTRDWYGPDTILRNRIRATLASTFERYGYDRLETPMIEKRDAIAFKGGGEIQREVFALSDQGDRGLALRFDQTVPLARYLASDPNIRLPFKRYAIGEVFRDGPAQPGQGRYRTFTQCDVDVVGVRDMTAEAELFALAQDAFMALGLGDVDVNINNRKLLDGILDYAGVPVEARLRTIVTLDKLDKIGKAGVESELRELRLFNEGRKLSDNTFRNLVDEYRSSGANGLDNLAGNIVQEMGQNGLSEIRGILSSEEPQSSIISRLSGYSTMGQLLLTAPSVDKLVNLIEITSEAGLDNEKIYALLKERVQSPIGLNGLSEIRTLLDYANGMGFEAVRLNPTLARGLDYYTGTTIEVFLKDRTIVPSAILAGGRFDDMIGDFRGKGEEIPAVGFSFGLERLAMILGERETTPQTVRQLYLVPIGNNHSACLRMAHELRKANVNVDISLQSGVKPGKAIEFALKSGIPYVGFIGDNEVVTSQIRVKTLKTGEQRDLPLPLIPGSL